MKQYLAGYVYWHQVTHQLAGMFRVQAPQRSRNSIWPCQIIDLLHTLFVFCVSCAPASGGVIVGDLRKSPARRSRLPTQ